MDRSHTKHRRRARSRTGFTIVELMIAVSILIVVILAASKIFQTAGRVASVGEASSNLLQDIAGIERQLRTDIAALAREGFFGIQCHSVRNDINGIGTLLNPNLPPDARIRADQLVFFTNGVESSHNYANGQRDDRKGQGMSARIYYGHGFQCPEGPASSGTMAIDPDPGQFITPWWTGTANFTRYNTTSNYVASGSAGNFDITQPQARQWLLLRQQVMMVDDGDQFDLYLQQVTSGSFLSNPEVINGRVDAVAQRVAAERLVSSGPRNESIRRQVTQAGNSVAQRNYMAQQYMRFPRAERRAPSMSRVDYALTNSVISSGCSSFRVEWTYAPGVGEVFPSDDGAHFGVHHTGSGTPVPAQEDIQWFGLPEWDYDNNVYTGAVVPYTAYNRKADSIFEDNIEGGFVIDNPNQNIDIWTYNAIFGFNQDKPFLNTALPTPLPARTGTVAQLARDAGYTPWPTAIRVTMTLHDPAGTLEAGREIQFIVKLPDRVN